MVTVFHKCPRCGSVFRSPFSVGGTATIKLRDNLIGCPSCRFVGAMPDMEMSVSAVTVQKCGSFATLVSTLEHLKSAVSAVRTKEDVERIENDPRFDGLRQLFQVLRSFMKNDNVKWWVNRMVVLIGLLLAHCGEKDSDESQSPPSITIDVEQVTKVLDGRSDTETPEPKAAPSPPAVGRNAPCPCGSTQPDGRPKKYKHCCLPNGQAGRLRITQSQSGEEGSGK